MSDDLTKIVSAFQIDFYFIYEEWERKKNKKFAHAIDFVCET